MDFYNDTFICWLMFFGSLAATLFSLLSAKEQSDRIKNSGLGALASGIVSIIITLSGKGEVSLLVYSFAGSSFGALIGWLILYLFVRKAVIKGNLGDLVLIELLYSGLSGVKIEIEKERDQKTKMLKALQKWNVDFRMTMNKQLADIDKEIPDYETIIYNWLKITCDLYYIVLSILGKKNDSYSLDQYQIRASLIIIGKDNDEVKGNHWISYEGERKAFKRDKPFNKHSDAYKIVTDEISSPNIFDIKNANKNSQSRETSDKDGNYKSYIMFKVNRFSVITIDWPSEIEENDSFIRLYID